MKVFTTKIIALLICLVACFVTVPAEASDISQNSSETEVVNCANDGFSFEINKPRGTAKITFHLESDYYWIRFNVWTDQNNKSDLIHVPASYNKATKTYTSSINLYSFKNFGIYKIEAVCANTLLGSSTLNANYTPNFVYRLYNPNSGEHFYTLVQNEKDNLSKIGWKYEGIGWVSASNSANPVYRLYNPNSGDHHYTLDSSEYNNLGKLGWVQEGVCWYSPLKSDTDSTPIWRQYNPNAITGTHNFTTSQTELNDLLNVGWEDEGEAWRGYEYSSASLIYLQ